MRTYNVTLNGKTYQVEVEEVGVGKSHIRPAAAPVYTAPAQEAAPTPVATPAQATPAPAAPAQASTPAAAPVQAAGGTNITAGVTGKVFKVEATVGQAVKAGDTVIILEAMKMEIPVVAPADGTIASIHVAVGDAVAAGQTLASLN